MVHASIVAGNLPLSTKVLWPTVKGIRGEPPKSGKHSLFLCSARRASPTSKEMPPTTKMRRPTPSRQDERANGKLWSINPAVKMGEPKGEESWHPSRAGHHRGAGSSRGWHSLCLLKHWPLKRGWCQRERPQHRGDRGARKSEPSGSEAKRGKRGILLNSVPTTPEMAVGAHADREVQQGERAPRTREHPSPIPTQTGKKEVGALRSPARRRRQRGGHPHL